MTEKKQQSTALRRWIIFSKYLLFVIGSALYVKFAYEFESGKHKIPLAYLFGAGFFLLHAWNRYRIDKVDVIKGRVSRILGRKGKRRR